MKGHGPFTLECFGEQKQHVFTITLPAPISPGRNETLSNYCHGLHRRFKKNFFLLCKDQDRLRSLSPGHQRNCACCHRWIALKCRFWLTVILELPNKVRTCGPHFEQPDCTHLYLWDVTLERLSYYLVAVKRHQGQSNS